ncbi:MAG: hypothetical protein GX303_02185, partial [Clostridiales bacterium]|nr:hypothetical protein [Clostridiales bacterium]
GSLFSSRRQYVDLTLDEIIQIQNYEEDTYEEESSDEEELPNEEE